MTLGNKLVTRHLNPVSKVKVDPVINFFTVTIPHLLASKLDGNAELIIQIGDSHNESSDASNTVQSALETYRAFSCTGTGKEGVFPPLREGGKYRQAWLDFLEWVDHEDLTIEVRYEHDGVGERSWHILEFTPKNGEPVLSMLPDQVLKALTAFADHQQADGVRAEKQTGEKWATAYKNLVSFLKQHEAT